MPRHSCIYLANDAIMIENEISFVHYNDRSIFLPLKKYRGLCANNSWLHVKFLLLQFANIWIFSYSQFHMHSYFLVLVLQYPHILICILQNSPLAWATRNREDIFMQGTCSEAFNPLKRQVEGELQHLRIFLWFSIHTLLIIFIYQSRYSHCQLVEVNAHSLFSKWFSESGKLVRNLWSFILIKSKQAFSYIVFSFSHARSQSFSKKSRIWWMKKTIWFLFWLVSFKFHMFYSIKNSKWKQQIMTLDPKLS